MQRPQSVTRATHTEESTTLLDYKTTESSTLDCNIVTEFYLYSIVYIYLIKSRLDVTFSVRHHFRIKLYHSPLSLMFWVETIHQRLYGR